MALEADVVVVGTGAAGGIVAKELTEAGFHVLCLEAGPAIEPERDQPDPPPPKRPLADRLIALRRQPVQMRCPAFRAHTARFFVDDRENPYRTPSDRPFQWFRGRQVGGRLRTWARVVVRLSERELRAASVDGYGVDWPLAYADLAPAYDRVESFLGVRGSRDELAEIPDGRVVAPRPLNARELAFRRSAEASRGLRVVSARVVEHDPGRLPAVLRMASETGRLEIRADAVVTRVEVDRATGLARAVTFVDRRTRKPHVARGRAVVLCASTIETIRLLLHSTSARHPDGIGASSGVLGSHLMDHVLSGIGGPIEGAPEPDEGDADDFARPVGLYVPRFDDPVAVAAPFLRGYAMLGGIGRGKPTWFLLAHGEMLAREENRVTLDPNLRDAWGVPAARIACAHGDNERCMAADQLAVLHELARAAGLRVRIPVEGGLLSRLAFRVYRRRLLAPSGAFWPGSAIHEIGGARMGLDPATSVVSPALCTWDVPNLYVADGSVFPSGCSQNVTLTIMALAVRASGHLAAALRSGDFP